MHYDAVTVAPKVHKLIYEDEQLRMIEVQIKPGEQAAMHRHPRNVTYILQGGTLRFTDKAGAIKDVTFAEGHTASMPETSHAVENIGSTDVHAIQIELKK